MNTEMSPVKHPRAVSIASGTGTELTIWVQRIEEIGGRDLDHAAIARLLPERWDVTEWWAQGVTVAYEQVIGRRVVGQSCDGDFSASASRTVDGDMDAVRELWAGFMTPERRDRLGIEEPRTTDTATWRYWRAAVADGTRVSVNITAKDGKNRKDRQDRQDHQDSKDGVERTARSTLAIEHKGIETAEGRDVWKAAWTRTLEDFTDSQDLPKET